MSSVNEFVVLRKNDRDDGNDDVQPPPTTTTSGMADRESCVRGTFDDLVENVFRFTLNPTPIGRHDGPVVCLPDAFDTLKEAAGTELEVLKHAVFERTLLADPGAHLLRGTTTGFGGRDGVSAALRHAVQTDCVVYLFQCFAELLAARRGNCFPSVGHDAYNKMFGYLCTNVSTALKQPELYSPQDVHQQVGSAPFRFNLFLPNSACSGFYHSKASTVTRLYLPN